MNRTPSSASEQPGMAPKRPSATRHYLRVLKHLCKLAIVVGGAGVIVVGTGADISIAGGNLFISWPPAEG